MCRGGILMSWVSTGKTRSDPLHSQTLGNKSRNPLPPLIQVLLCLYFVLRTKHVKISLSPWAILLHRPSHKFLAWEPSFYLGTFLLCQTTQTKGILVFLIMLALLPLDCLLFFPHQEKNTFEWLEGQTSSSAKIPFQNKGHLTHTTLDKVCHLKCSWILLVYQIAVPVQNSNTLSPLIQREGNFPVRPLFLLT